MKRSWYKIVVGKETRPSWEGENVGSATSEYAYQCKLSMRGTFGEGVEATVSFYKDDVLTWQHRAVAEKK